MLAHSHFPEIVGFLLRFHYWTKNVSFSTWEETCDIDEGGFQT